MRSRLDAARAWLKETENREQSADLEALEGAWLSARGEAEPARRSFARAVALAKESGSRAAMLHTRIAGASAAASRGEAAAATELSRALAEAESLGHALLTILAAEGLAHAEAARGRWPRAEELARRALRIADQTGWEAGRYRLSLLLARSLEKQGDRAGSGEAYARAAREAAKLRENVPAAMRSIFDLQPTVREALSRGLADGKVRLGG